MSRLLPPLQSKRSLPAAAIGGRSSTTPPLRLARRLLHSLFCCSCALSQQSPLRPIANPSEPWPALGCSSAPRPPHHLITHLRQRPPYCSTTIIMPSKLSRRRAKSPLPLRAAAVSPFASPPSPHCCISTTPISPTPLEYSSPTKPSLRKKALSWISSLKSPSTSLVGSYGPAIEHRPTPPITPTPRPMSALRRLSRYSKDIASLEGALEKEATLRAVTPSSPISPPPTIHPKSPTSPIAPMRGPNGVKISIFPPRNAPPTPPQFSPTFPIGRGSITSPTSAIFPIGHASVASTTSTIFPIGHPSITSPTSTIFGLETCTEDMNPWDSPPSTPPPMSPMSLTSTRPLTLEQKSTSDRILENAARKIIAADAMKIEAARRDWGPRVATEWGTELAWLKKCGFVEKKRKKKKSVRGSLAFLRGVRGEDSESSSEEEEEMPRGRYVWGNVSREVLDTLRGEVWASLQ